ncbi:MAG TPA: hypothetical protein VGH28_32195 [Polyangiaceae bacterium]
MVDDDEVDSGWPADGEAADAEKNRPTLAPPQPDPKRAPEPATKPKRPTPAVLRLDSASQFERPDPSAVISRRGRESLLGLADDAPDDLSLDPAAEPSEALDLVAREAERETPIVPLPAPVPPPPAVSSGRIVEPVQEMRERFSLGDYSGALVVAESILEDDPSHVEALQCETSCRQVLEQMYTARIGPLDRVPFVAVPPEQLRWLSLDHRAGFVLSHVDGNCSLDQILDVSGMPPLDALRILYELLQQRVIGFR